jgi:GT2 family glycosyltransferase
MRLIENTPFNEEKDLAKAYNDFMELLPYDTDWAFFRDADTLFLDSFYGKHMLNIIRENPEYSCITGCTNRIGSPALLHDEYEGDDITIHRRISSNMKLLHGNMVTTLDYVADVSTLSGMCFAINKGAWKKSGGFRSGVNGMVGVDNNIHLDLINSGSKVGLAKGFYIYHWYRGGNKLDNKHLM